MKKDVKLMGKQGKNNALILYQVLMKYSDKEHPLSMSDIKDYMAEETAECGRDSIARYLNQLEEEMELSSCLINALRSALPGIPTGLCII
jgi:hypothetical protein